VKVLVSIFGLIYNGYGEKGFKDIRHCWDNIKNKIIVPLETAGHEVSINIITQETADPIIENEIIDFIKPSNFVKVYEIPHGGYTTKLKALEILQDSEQNFNILTRADIHFTDKPIIEHLNFNKFNFLFPERGWWLDTKFTTDNFYAWDNRYSNIVYQAMKETKYDHCTSTHNMYHRLSQYLKSEDYNFVSMDEELSDINTFYTLCRGGHHLDHPDFSCMHNEVFERYYKSC
jgi:hypothetical protein